VLSDEEPSGDGKAAAPAEPEAEAETEEEPEAEEEKEPEAKEEEPEAVEKPPKEEPAKKEPSAGGESRLLSPVVRRLIADNDLDPDQIEGTGAGGRLTRNDVLAHIEGGGDKPKAAPAKKEAAKKEAPEKPEPAKPAAAKPAAEAVPAPQAGEGDEVVPFTNIRRRTAEHMIRSKATSAHVLTAIEVDFENVDRVRAAHKQAWKEKEGFSLTYLPFISRAVIDALKEFPHLNASVGDDELIVHNYVNLGVAVDLDFEGLIVPVIQDADGKRLRAIAREIVELANRARGKKLSADDIVGGTFTITNPGPYGTFISAPVINQPQIAILSTEAVKRRPVVIDLPDGSEGISIHSIGYLAMSWDHRATDGAYASAFLAKLREILETRDWEAELA
jgi:2-oxoglutarate dehydrogenase E2 component (dihydrolipoamide succinyltransferase)